MTHKIYDRQPEESSKAFEAFTIYRDMGTNRSIEAAWKRYSESDKRVPGYFGDWARNYDWVERAEAWDDVIEAKARAKIERDAVKQKVDMLQRHALAGRVLQRKGVEYIDKNGVDKSVDAIAAISKGVEIERKAAGLPEWIFEVVNADDNELARQYAELLAQIGSAGSGDEAPGDTDTPAADSSAAAE